MKKLMMLLLLSTMACAGEGSTVLERSPPPPANQAPVVVATLPDMEVHETLQIVRDVSHVFVDPDGDRLVLSVASRDTLTARTGFQARETIRAIGVGEGQTDITLTATDPDRASASTDFTLTVLPRPNRAPELAQVLPDRELTYGAPIGIDVGKAFRDPDGDSLTLEAVSEDESIVKAILEEPWLNLAPVALGSSSVVLTATDPDSASTSARFSVTVLPRPNRAPELAQVLPDREVTYGAPIGIDVGKAFRDPDGDSLTLEAVSEDESIIKAILKGPWLNLAPVALGSSSVVLTATDPDSASTSGRFSVTVLPRPNRAPELVLFFPDQELRYGTPNGLDVGKAFRDPDGDSLTLEAVSEDESIVRAILEEPWLTLAPVALGSSSVVLTATDPDSASTSVRFSVTVLPQPNRSPVVASAPSSVVLEHDGTRELNLSPLFADPDGDTLVYAAESSDTTVVVASVADTLLTLSAVTPGEASVTLVATDPDSAQVSSTLEVTVSRPPPTSSAGPANAFSNYLFPSTSRARRLEWTFRPLVFPDTSLHEKKLLHYYAMQFKMQSRDLDSKNGGYAGLQTDGTLRGIPHQGRVVNFSIWDQLEAKSDGMINPENDECKCAQIMYQYEWETGRDYRFVVDDGPSGENEEGRWIGLWVTDVEADSTTFIGEIRARESKFIESYGWQNDEGNVSSTITAFSEDVHFWHTLKGKHYYTCADFEHSVVAVLDVRLDGRSPHAATGRTNGGKVQFANGHASWLCDTATVYQSGFDFQHNVGYWETPAPNFLDDR